MTSVSCLPPPVQATERQIAVSGDSYEIVSTFPLYKLLLVENNKVIYDENYILEYALNEVEDLLQDYNSPMKFVFTQQSILQRLAGGPTQNKVLAWYCVKNAKRYSCFICPV